MNCPVCNTVELQMADRQGVEIDYCPKCRGVWLDRGELDKIMERSAAQANSAAVEYRSGGDQGNHHYEHKHRKRSFLSELFD
jgi:uncharacterized protein